MDTSKVSAIMITEEEFDQAVMMNADKSLHDPRFEGHLEAAMLFSMNGVVFCKELKNILFSKGESSNDQ